MAKPILYGFHLSPPVRCVLLVAKAIGLDLDWRELDLFAGEQKDPEFLAKNPQHTVPTLDDNGQIVWDSHAISTYLIGKYAKDDSLYPKDLYRRAVIDQRLHFNSGVLFNRLAAITYNLFFKDEPIPQEKIQALDEAYDFLEKFLANDAYLGGNAITVADFACITTVTAMEAILQVDSVKYPKLSAWIGRIEKIPYYHEISGQYAKQLVELVHKKNAELTGK